MNCKRNWLSNGLWALFFLLNLCLLCLSCSKFLYDHQIYSLNENIVVIAAFLVAVASLSILIIYIMGRFPYVSEKRWMSVVSAIVLIGILFLSAWLFYGILMQGNLKGISETTLYQHAVILSQRQESFEPGLLAQGYVLLLSLLLRFFGNKPVVAGGLQIGILLICMLLIYMIVKKISAKRGSALAAVILFMCFCMFQNNDIKLTTDLLLALLFLAVNMFSVFMFLFAKNRYSGIWSLLLGALTGFLAGFHPVFMICFIATFFEMLMLQYITKTIKIIDILIYTLSFMTGLFVPIISAGYFSTQPVFTYVIQYVQSLYGVSFHTELFQIEQLGLVADISYLFFVCAFCFVYLFTYWKQKKDSGHFFIIQFCMILIGIFFLKEEYRTLFQLLIPVVLTLIAGCGFKNLYSCKTARTALKVEEEQQEKAADSFVQNDEGIQGEPTDMTEAWLKAESEGIKEPEPKAESDNSRESAIRPATEELMESVAEKKQEAVELIENPLPLPKKHMHRDMDYAFEPEEDKMHYDRQLTDQNNFYDVE